MNLRLRLALAAVLVLRAAPARAADSTVAAAMGAGAAKLAAEGKTEKAKDMCYQALANDEGCVEALYELGKIFQKEGKTIAAGDFLLRAAQLLGKAEVGNPAFTSKRLDAERRLRDVNPFALRLASLLGDYSQELDAIIKKAPDGLTAEEALSRIRELRLADVLPQSKLPAIDTARAVANPAAQKLGPANDASPPPETPRAAAGLPPDVERALKAAGWAAITGNWRKKGDNVYEVTDGKLEAPKVNGGVQVLIHKGSTGQVKVMVRNNQYQPDGHITYHSAGFSKGFDRRLCGTGFGFQVEPAAAKMYQATFSYYFAGSKDLARPYMEREAPLPNPKNKIQIQITENKLEMFLNDQREHLSNYKLSKDGPFVIEIAGTWTIESPRAVGQ
jgi:hypothetical protein